MGTTPQEPLTLEIPLSAAISGTPKHFSLNFNTLKNDLEIRAANGRELWLGNLSAPRLLRPVPQGARWAVQTVCVPTSSSRDRPVIGGLLLWKDKKDAGRTVYAVFVTDVSGSMAGSRISSVAQALASAREGGWISFSNLRYKNSIVQFAFQNYIFAILTHTLAELWIPAIYP